MKNEDRLFELYKIYIPIMYEYNIKWDHRDMPDLGIIRKEALYQAENSLEYFNSKIEE